MLFNKVDFSNQQESYNKSCYSTKWTSPTHKGHIHPAIFYLSYFILINHVIQQSGLLQPTRVISLLPHEDVVYFLMGMAYFFLMLINNVIQQNGLLQPTRVISILPSFIYFILY
jgi:hypothetical protein